MDEMSETESQRCDSKVDNDGSAIPNVITDEYFEEIITKGADVSLVFDFSFILFNSQDNYDYAFALRFKFNVRRIII